MSEVAIFNVVIFNALIFLLLFILAHCSCKVSDLWSVPDKVLPAGWTNETRKKDFLPVPIFFIWQKVPERVKCFL